MAIQWMCLGMAVGLLSASIWQFVSPKDPAKKAHPAILVSMLVMGLFWLAVGLLPLLFPSSPHPEIPRIPEMP